MCPISLLLRTLRTTFTELRSLFTSSASRYSAASAIHANVSSFSGLEVGTTNNKTQSTSVTKH